MKRGFSFVEIVFAVAILAIIGVFVIAALSSSAREVKTTSEYSLSMFLSQKIVEELIQSTHENLRYEQSLATIGPNRISVAGSVHPFFTAVEDSRPVNGLLEPPQDVGIEPIAPNLHKLYREFNLTIGTTNQTLPATPEGTPQVLAVQMQFDWPGLKGVDRDYQFPVTLSKPQPAVKPKPLLAQDLPGMDAAIQPLIYPAGPAPLTAACPAANGTLSVARDIGAVMALYQTVEKECLAIDNGSPGPPLVKGIKALELDIPALSADPTGEGELRLKIAGMYERKAALQLFALLYLEDVAFRQLGFRKTDLGDDGKFDRVQVITLVAEATRLMGGALRDLEFAVHHYTTARVKLGAASTRHYRRLVIERKILELLKLRIMLEDSGSTAYMKEWLDYLLTAHTGRNRAFADYLTREKNDSQDLAAVKAANPVMAQRANDAREAKKNLDDLSTRVSTELAL